MKKSGIPDYPDPRLYCPQKMTSKLRLEYAVEVLQDRETFDERWLRRSKKEMPDPRHNGYKQIENNIKELSVAIKILKEINL